MGGGSHVVIYKLPRQWTTILIFDVVGLAFFLEKSEANVNLSWYNYQYASDIMHAKNLEFTEEGGGGGRVAGCITFFFLRDIFQLTRDIFQKSNPWHFWGPK